MKTAQEYLDKAVKQYGSHLRIDDIAVTEFVALEAIRKAQIDAYQEGVKHCRKEYCNNEEIQNDKNCKKTTN